MSAWISGGDRGEGSFEASYGLVSNDIDAMTGLDSRSKFRIRTGRIHSLVP